MKVAIAKYAAFSALFLIGCGGATLGGTGSDAADGGTSPESGTASTCVDACVSSELSWDENGGFTNSTAVSNVTCTSYSHQESSDSGDLSCTDALSTGCGASTITAGDIASAFYDDDVQAAFAGSTQLFGNDPRGCDGSVLEITYQSKSIDVGTDCSSASGCGGGPSTGCVPIPAGLKSLATLLQQVDAQEIKTKDCASVFPGG